MIILDDIEQGTEAWHKARAGVITASIFREATSTVDDLDERQAAYVKALLAGVAELEARAVAGYKNKPTSELIARALAGERVGRPSDVAERQAITKGIERIIGRPYGSTDTGSFRATERGHIGEEFARMRYEARFELMVDQPGMILTDDKVFGYSPDGLVHRDGLIEAKVPMDLLKVVHIITTGDLGEYMHQMQGGMWITGRKWCDFLMGVPDLKALNNGNELYVKRVHRDDNFIDSMVEKLWAFEQRVRHYEALLRKPFNLELVQTALAGTAPANDAQGAADSNVTFLPVAAEPVAAAAPTNRWMKALAA